MTSQGCLGGAGGGWGLGHGLVGKPCSRPVTSAWAVSVPGLGCGGQGRLLAAAGQDLGAGVSVIPGKRSPAVPPPAPRCSEELQGRLEAVAGLSRSCSPRTCGAPDSQSAGCLVDVGSEPTEPASLVDAALGSGPGYWVPHLPEAPRSSPQRPVSWLSSWKLPPHPAADLAHTQLPGSQR